jgi:hypothetical protein
MIYCLYLKIILKLPECHNANAVNADVVVVLEDVVDAHATRGGVPNNQANILGSWPNTDVGIGG